MSDLDILKEAQEREDEILRIAAGEDIEAPQEPEITPQLKAQIDERRQKHSTAVHKVVIKLTDGDILTYSNADLFASKQYVTVVKSGARHNFKRQDVAGFQQV